MTSPFPITRKRYLTFPPPEPASSRLRRGFAHLLGAITLPLTLVFSWLAGGPGIGTRLRSLRLGLRALRHGDRKLALDFFIFPMDSFRYFEVAYVQAQARQLKSLDSYLDVSSPRLVPLTVIDERPGLNGDLINPIEADLLDTERTAAGLGLARRCRTSAVMLEDTTFSDDAFELITSVSVVEHIPDDTAAIATMWRLLKPGGMLVLTLPCARQASEEYTTLDEYQLFEASDDGFVYWQRYYDQQALQDRIWSITGAPTDVAIFGERSPGAYDRNVIRKRAFANYNYWSEPLMMAREYRRYDKIDDLPGMGVIGMTFVKSIGRRDG